ncbi:hypothetical protein [Rhodoferax mekongensis]|uniref:Uncharacterized protein n=1 Tax=Rhodoferax mekongensis TaxID=3068341 RepID=A0ABZ0AWV2_9BURK|nr:hypothetical protein [Rhodoferax sp. TBRC 17307]WNO03985.1 hypothetical protein RAN89_13845 [Rhodoferax sp. TBRC 17307]
MQGKTVAQRKATVQQVAIAAAAFAKLAGKSLALEDLNFGEKEKHLAALKGTPRLCRRKRQLSSFGYSVLGQAIHGRALLETVPVAEVHPAFISVIGRIKYAKR